MHNNYVSATADTYNALMAFMCNLTVKHWAVDHQTRVSFVIIMSCHIEK